MRTECRGRITAAQHALNSDTKTACAAVKSRDSMRKVVVCCYATAVSL
jgi:hypothetical protein